MSLKATAVENDQIGWFRIFVTPPGGGQKTEITTFREVPIQISSMGTSDPFGETSMSLEFPQVTPWDRPGQGDLSWLVPYAQIDVIWHNMPGFNYLWRWEGFVVDESVSLDEQSSNYTVECKGALYQLDNYLAKPSFPAQPIPYEQLIYDSFDPNEHPGSAVQPLRIIWPADWRVKVEEWTTSDRLWFLRPYGVTPGQKWTGLATRSTGTWEPTLTSYVQGLLGVMFDESGAQWTIRNDPGRVPVLYLRKQAKVDDPNLLTINMGTPGLSLQISRDFTQAANVIYGAGKDIAGTTFSGARVSDDGSETVYEPMAYSAAVYPDRRNPSYNENIARREVQMQFPNGMDELSAREVARAQHYRFSDPGFTGQITLKTDPITNGGTRFPRMLIKAGSSILVKGFRGGNLLMHITQAQVNLDSGETTLTVDSKYRDALTVAEVRERTRDALTPIRLLKPGQFTAVTQDMLVPWDYEAGSGFLPLGSQELFRRTARNDVFPWEKLTKKYPPKKYPQYYIRVHNKNRMTKPIRSWARRPGHGGRAIPIRMAQAGDIRLSQIAAFDRDGNQIPVRFHVGVYGNRGTTAEDMPMMPSDTHKYLGPAGSSYGGGARTPFFKNAFESILPTGAEPSSQGYTFHRSVDLQMAWGNYYEPAGHWPGLASRGAPKTGLLVDETPWHFDSTRGKDFDPRNPHMRPWRRGTGMLFLMVYCDDRPAGYDGPVFFLGRFYREEPGQ